MPAITGRRSNDPGRDTTNGLGRDIDRLLKPDSDSAQLRPHVVSPASGAFMAIGNGESREKIGQQLINETKELVRSPLVLAMWAELAKASRWQSSPPSWAEVFAAARDPERWKAATRARSASRSCDWGTPTRNPTAVY